jgi:hypothetical protein
MREKDETTNGPASEAANYCSIAAGRNISAKVSKRYSLSLSNGLEFEDNAGGYFGVVLISAEVARAEQVGFEPVAKPMMGLDKIYASSKLVRESAFRAVRRLRSEVRHSNQCVGKDLQVSRTGPPETRTSSAE